MLDATEFAAIDSRGLWMEGVAFLQRALENEDARAYFGRHASAAFDVDSRSTTILAELVAADMAAALGILKG